METTIMGLYRGYIGYILGFYRDYIGDNGKENGNYYNGFINLPCSWDKLRHKPPELQHILPGSSSASQVLHLTTCS